ncbi:hypothetical protein D3C76_1785880 [compost metagenome]
MDDGLHADQDHVGGRSVENGVNGLLAAEDGAMGTLLECWRRCAVDSCFAADR